MLNAETGVMDSGPAPRGASRNDESKPLADEPRTLQPVSPGQVDRFCQPDPHAGDNIGFADPRMQRVRRLVERQGAMLDGDAERLAQFALPRAQRAFVIDAAT